MVNQENWLTLTLHFCSQKDLGTNWTGKWVLIRRGAVVVLSANSTPVCGEAEYSF